MSKDISSFNAPCDCQDKHAVGIEYGPFCPDHYDGVSEIMCLECKRRWGRWSGKELKEGETEPPYGKQH